jgi:hypothetical protein
MKPILSRQVYFAYTSSAIKPNTPPIAIFKSRLLAAAPVNVAILCPAVCVCTPGGRVPVAEVAPPKNGALPVATVMPVVDGAAGAAATRPTLVIGTAGGTTAPGGPLVNGAGGGVAVTNATWGTVTAVVTMIVVDAEEMV